MTDIDYKFVDHCGRVILHTKGLMTLMKNGKPIDGILVDINEETEKYNKLKPNKIDFYTDRLKSQTVEEFDKEHTMHWMTPSNYQDLDVKTFLINKCTNQTEIDRVNFELNLYEERDLLPLLKHLIYLIDHFRKNKIVWGVGRGSSVSSYILYLIGVHKVNSIKYNLDVTEFLR